MELPPVGKEPIRASGDDYSAYTQTWAKTWESFQEMEDDLFQFCQNVSEGKDVGDATTWNPFASGYSILVTRVEQGIKQLGKLIAEGKAPYPAKAAYQKLQESFGLLDANIHSASDYYKSCFHLDHFDPPDPGHVKVLAEYMSQWLTLTGQDLGRMIP